MWHRWETPSTLTKLYLGASVPQRAKAREVHGLCWLENMEIRCGPNVVLVGVTRDVKLECFGQPELGFHFPPNLVHLGNYPVQFRAAPALVPTNVGCGRVLQETNISDGVCVRSPQDVPEQPCGFSSRYLEKLFIFLFLLLCFVPSLIALLASSNTRSFVFLLSMKVVFNLSICLRPFS